MAVVFLMLPLDTKAARCALAAGFSTDLVQATGTREAVKLAAIATLEGMDGE